MSDTKVILKKKVAKRPAKIYSVAETLEKYNLTPQEFQEIAQTIPEFTKQIVPKGITKSGYMMVGKAVKKLNKAIVKKVEEKVEANRIAEEEAPNIRYLQVCEFKPPNQQKLWCIDTIDGVQSKVVVNASPKFVAGVKKGVSIRCERITEGLFAYKPLESDR